MKSVYLNPSSIAVGRQSKPLFLTTLSTKVDGVLKAGMSLIWGEGGQGPLSPEVCFCSRGCHLGASRCRLSAGAQVKAALWIPLAPLDGPLWSEGAVPSSEWLPEDLVPR